MIVAGGDSVTKPTFYLDLDGVLFNFVSASIETCDLPLTHDDVKTWNYFEPYMSALEFWKRIHEQQYFWEDLPVYPWAGDLIDMLEKYGDVVFCTDPSHDDESATGKLRALKRHGFLALGGTNYVLCKDKWRLARENTWLIDDSTANCGHFLQHGGNALVFPQIWNGMYVDSKVKYVWEVIR
jgi:5'(3')-deoxyribonucleotidase